MHFGRRIAPRPQSGLRDALNWGARVQSCGEVGNAPVGLAETASTEETLLASLNAHRPMPDMVKAGPNNKQESAMSVVTVSTITAGRASRLAVSGALAFAYQDSGFESALTGGNLDAAEQMPAGGCIGSHLITRAGRNAVLQMLSGREGVAP